MKIDDKILREVLQEKIEIIKGHSRIAPKEVTDWMVDKYNVKYSLPVDIFNGIVPIETLNYEMLYKFMKSIHDGLQERANEIDLSELNEDKYFTEIEIKQYSQPYVHIVNDSDIIFASDWFQMDQNRYSVKASINDIIKWRDLGKIKYNVETQRDLIEKTSNGVLYKKIDINEDAIQNMCELMKNNEFYSDDITLNINTDINTSSDLLPYVADGKLIIPKNAQIDIIDGFHRYRAMCLVKDSNPNWEYDCGIKIVTWNTEKAQMFILLQDKKNHLKSKQATRINKNDEANYVLDELNSSSKFHLKGKINKELWADLNVIINSVFSPKKREDSIPLIKLLQENINNLVAEKNLFDKSLSKEEWFIYLYLIDKAAKNNLEYIDLISKIDIDELLKEIQFKNKPLVKHYKLIDQTVKGVSK